MAASREVTFLIGRYKGETREVEVEAARGLVARGEAQYPTYDVADTRTYGREEIAQIFNVPDTNSRQQKRGRR